MREGGLEILYRVLEIGVDGVGGMLLLALHLRLGSEVLGQLVQGRQKKRQTVFKVEGPLAPIHRGMHVDVSLRRLGDKVNLLEVSFMNMLHNKVSIVAGQIVEKDRDPLGRAELHVTHRMRGTTISAGPMIMIMNTGTMHS